MAEIRTTVAEAPMELSDQIIRDAYDVIGDLMAGIGRLALDADRITRINETCVALERAGVRQIPDRLAKTLS